MFMKKIYSIIDILKKSIAAGMLIGISSILYLLIPDKIIGALLFSTALLIICTFQMNLFTGKIGYIHTFYSIPEMLLIYFGNLIGSSIVSLTMRFANSTLNEKATILMQEKVANPLWASLFLGFFCGCLMYFAVESYKLSKSALGIILCVSAFILCGFEHCIADINYCLMAVSGVRQALYEYMPFILTVTIGNTFGAMFARVLSE